MNTRKENALRSRPRMSSQTDTTQLKCLSYFLPTSFKYRVDFAGSQA